MIAALRRVLLVEDNPGDAELIVDLLMEATVPPETIERAATLAEAASHLRAATPDAVLLDLGLPDGAGIDCVGAIRALASEVPIVVLTGTEDPALALACLAAGAQDYLSKREVNTQALHRALRYARARCAESSQRRRADALQTRLAAIVEASSDAIVSRSVDGVITSWNPSAARIFGIGSAEAIGRRAADLLPPHDAAATASGAARETVWRRADGALLTLSVLVSPLRDAAGAAIGTATTFRDVTEQRSLETQLAFSDRMVAIGSLAAGVAHEINNPLAAVVVNLQMAREHLAELKAPVPREILAELDDAELGAQRVSRIVRDLKLLARAQDDRPGPVDLQRTIESALRVSNHEIRHRARLVTDLKPTPPVHASEPRLAQVIVNLLVNAAQAIPEGHAEGNEIRVATGTDERGRVTFTVSDTGCGMPADVQRKLFTAFFTTKPIGVGTGLGLAISQRIVTSFGGSIAFESEVGRGTRFTVTLTPSAEAVPVQAAPVVAESSGRRARLLVVDDEELLLKLVQRVLARDHDVAATSSAAQALRLLQGGQPFDLILCDLMMPEVSGMTFFEEVRRARPGLQERIVFMTGGAFTEEASTFLESVRNRRIEKPFDSGRLRALVRELLA